jgi:hypothetical protein|tara:strand:- start:2215 stop:5475 length:3261 start_codon:yes stop_codon:yes gene_type:complete
MPLDKTVIAWSTTHWGSGNEPIIKVYFDAGPCVATTYPMPQGNGTPPLSVVTASSFGQQICNIQDITGDGYGSSFPGNTSTGTMNGAGNSTRNLISKTVSNDFTVSGYRTYSYELVDDPGQITAFDGDLGGGMTSGVPEGSAQVYTIDVWVPGSDIQRDTLGAMPVNVWQLRSAGWKMNQGYIDPYDAAITGHRLNGSVLVYNQWGGAASPILGVSTDMNEGVQVAINPINDPDNRFYGELLFPPIPLTTTWGSWPSTFDTIDFKNEYLVQGITPTIQPSDCSSANPTTGTLPLQMKGIACSDKYYYWLQAQSLASTNNTSIIDEFVQLMNIVGVHQAPGYVAHQVNQGITPQNNDVMPTLGGWAINSYQTSQAVNDPCTNITYTVSSVIVTQNNCNSGVNIGAIDITPTWGTSPYTILQTAGPGSLNVTNITGTHSLTNLADGSYSFLITDSDGCFTTDNIVLACTPCTLDVQGTVTNPLCVEDKGSYEILSTTTTAGSVTYTYELTGTMSISSGPGQLGTHTFYSLIPGNYVVYITEDNTGCTDQLSFSIVPPSIMVLSSIVSNVTMYGLSDGSISLSATGGSAPYTYLWNTGDTGPNLTGLTAGTYSVQVTDINGCIINDSFTITEPECNLLLGGSVTGSSQGTTATTTTATAILDVNSTTLANFDGRRILIDIPDGSGGFTYYEIWFDATGSTTAPTAVSGYTQIEVDISSETTVTGIASVLDTQIGLYIASTELTTTLASGSDVINITFTNTGTAALAHASTNGTTNTELNIILTQQAGNDGSINLYDPIGGLPPYTYSWTGPNNYTATTQDISDLSTGYYTVEVCDSLGCCESVSFYVMPGDCITSCDADTVVNYLNSILLRCGCEINNNHGGRNGEGDHSELRTSGVRTQFNTYNTSIKIGNTNYSSTTVTNNSPKSSISIPRPSKPLQSIIKSPVFKEKDVSIIKPLENIIKIVDMGFVKEFTKSLKNIIDSGIGHIYTKLVKDNKKIHTELLNKPIDEVLKLKEEEIKNIQSDIDDIPTSISEALDKGLNPNILYKELLLEEELKKKEILENGTNGMGNIYDPPESSDDECDSADGC